MTQAGRLAIRLWLLKFIITGPCKCGLHPTGPVTRNRASEKPRWFQGHCQSIRFPRRTKQYHDTQTYQAASPIENYFLNALISFACATQPRHGGTPGPISHTFEIRFQRRLHISGEMARSFEYLLVRHSSVVAIGVHSRHPSSFLSMLPESPIKSLKFDKSEVSNRTHLRLLFTFSVTVDKRGWLGAPSSCTTS